MIVAVTRWPAKCLIENAAVHPTQPWLAVAGTEADGETGAVMVFDLQAGTLRSVATHEGTVGWSDPDLLQWHPDGRRLATNVDTNGIALLDGTTWVGFAFPDDTRDSGVQYAWVDDRMFTDTRAFFEIRPGDRRFEFAELTTPDFHTVRWNASIGAVVGRTSTGVAAYDPRQERVVYAVDLEGSDRGPPLRLSPDGRWGVRWQVAVHPAPDGLLFVDGDTGAIHGTQMASSPRIDRMVWGPAGRLAVSSHVHHIGGPPSDRRLDLFVDGAPKVALDLGRRAIQASFAVAETSGIAWSPDGHGLALLLDGMQVRVHDAHSGRVLSEFAAPAPAIPSGLPDYYTKGHRPDFGFPGDLLWAQGQRLVRIAPHFVSVWSLDGQKIAELVVPV